MTDDKALEILDKVITNLPKSWVCYEQARQALLHLERNRTSTRVSMGPLDALDAIGVGLKSVSSVHGVRVLRHIKDSVEDSIRGRLARECVYPVSIKWDEVVVNPNYTEARAKVSGVFLTEEQLKQYWSVLAYGE